ncbi:hypothetical protein GCM10007079_11480 [Nocardiopsis terrae]|uniref:4-amino-4-deoxy-L-arabinose transferase n=1 Tax=Nocardiopsis terrae TaxID=372655 RepID=A0ABR9HC91_9ACTN|nr:hypothetical protein [Nocardiopsis terrae]MBE1456640.1 hypothetical protein [Nocardiopsis terrae]GHC75803.1 hypothetical protein GCM10007079_11480 [Nocardiopsis terrae]
MGAPARVLPWTVGLVAAVLALGPALGPGYVLRYDMLFVPGLSLPTVLAGADGFPRAIPSDAVVAALSLVLPGDVVQALALLAVFTLGGAGAFRLLARLVCGAGRVPGPVLAAGAAAGTAYVWNPFVAERLLLGQWAVLLGYAGLPWVVWAVVRTASARPAAGLSGLVCSLVPAAVGGFSSVVLSALTAGPQALAGPRRWRSAGLFLFALVLVSLPWLVPSLSSGAATDPAGVEAFAARSDTPFGAVGSLLALGGVWNSGAVPPGYGEPVTALARLLLCAASLAGWAWWLYRAPPAVGTGLSVSAAAGFGIALLGVFAPGREFLAALIGLWPGFGPLRDGQLYLAPLALVQALGLGAVLLWLLRALPVRGGAGLAADTGGTGPAGERDRSGLPLWRVGAVVFTVFLPVVVLPGLLWGAGGRLAPVQYPDSWLAARDAVAADDRPGAVLVLPWSAYRGLEWSGEPVVVLDPATKLFDRRTLWNDDLRVGAEDGGSVVVTGEDARAREAARLLEPDPETALPGSGRSRDPDALAELLGGLGVRYVVVSAPVDNRFWSGAETLSPVVEESDMTLLEVSDQHIKADKDDISGLEVTGGLVTVGAIIWSIARSGSSLGFQRPQPRTGRGARKEIPK